MEEDIKILEGYLDRNTQLFEDYGENAIIQDKEIKALENLIKGYREKEERIIYLVNERKKLEELLFASNENYIEKLKVKEKMEELDKKIRKIENKKVWNEPADTVIRNRLCNYYNALKELMED